MSVAEWIYQVPLTHFRPQPVDEPVVSTTREDLAALRASLSGTLARKIGTAAELQRAHDHERSRQLPTMFECFDRLLGGGLERGKLVELTGRRSTGRFAIVLAALAAATQTGEAAALIDIGDSLDPQLAAASRVDLERLLWVRPSKLKDAVMAAEMLIQTGFALVVIDFGLRLRGTRPYEAAWVRLARAAEHHGAALLVSSPYPVSGTAADAVISASRGRAAWSGKGAAPKLLTEIRSTLTVEKHRGTRPGAHEEMQIAPVEKPRAERVRSSARQHKSSSREQKSSSREQKSSSREQKSSSREQKSSSRRSFVSLRSTQDDTAPLRSTQDDTASLRSTQDDTAPLRSTQDDTAPLPRARGPRPAARFDEHTAAQE